MITEEIIKYASEAIDYASKFMPEPDEEFHSNEICLAVYVTSLAQILLELSHNNDCTALVAEQPTPKSPDGDFVQS
jgi:hypothetical protein